MYDKLRHLMEKYEIFLIIFLALQPVIDVLTTLCLSLNINITFGVIIRFSILFMSILYTFIKSMQLGKKHYIYYLIILFCTIAIGFVYNYYSKPIFSIGEEGKFIIKVIYIIIMILTYSLAFSSLKIKLELENKLIKYILISSLIINIIMVVSIATSTSLTSYDYSKIGYSGWFYAGNEIGAILAICFPLILLYSIRSTNSSKDLYKWVPSALMLFSMLAVGTKVGYGASVLVLVIALFMLIVELYKTRATNSFKIYRLRSLFVGLILILLIASTPFAPIYKNTFAHMSLLGIELPSGDNSDDETTKKNGPTKGNEKINKKQMENLLLSSRELYLDKLRNDYKEAPLFQKIFGMGYAGNYTKVPKMIEMDFHDIFYSFGIIGSLIFLFPLLFLGVKLVTFSALNIKTVFNIKYSMYITSLFLAFGIAFSAGHVLTAPAVSIYIAAILAYLKSNLLIKKI